MKVKLCTMGDSSNVVNKEITVGHEMVLRLRGSIDMLEPELILRGEQFADGFNYAIFELPEPRYFFIREIESLGGVMFKYHLELDVLETYKKDLLNSNMRFRRNLENGDYVSSGFEEATTKQVKLVESDKELVKGNTMILTTLGRAK